MSGRTPRPAMQFESLVNSVILEQVAQMRDFQARSDLRSAQNLDAAKKPAPNTNEAPAKACAPVYFGPAALMIAPAIGGPVRVAKLFVVQTMPIRMPVFDTSAVSLVKLAGNKLWTPPAAMPYTTAQTYNPLAEETAIHPRRQIPLTSTNGTIKVRGPKCLSAKKFGVMRPIYPTPLMTRSKFNESR